MPVNLRSCSAAELLVASSSAVRARRLAEVGDLEVLAQWAALHGADPLEGLSGRERDHARRIGKVLRQVGGEGTPGVQDFCLGEIALARGTGVVATRNVMADVLDLVHRLPLTWAVCRSGAAEVWVARRVAARSRHLPADRVWVVDRAVARMIATEAADRVLDVADAKIVEADPAAHEERVRAAKERLFAAVSRSDADGLRTIVARVEAGDAAAVDAFLTQVAEALAAHDPDASLDQRRAKAMGYLARPAEAMTLLLSSVVGQDEPATEDPQDPQDPEDPGDPVVPARAFAFPADLLAALRDPMIAARLAPQAVLYVHLHQAALDSDSEEGVARVEGLGAYTLSQLQLLLAGRTVVVKPVIDLADRVRTTAYEHPEALKERVHLTTGGDYWPYAVSTSRNVDYDHPTPYRPPGPGAPPGGPPQTGTHNSGPLGRRHHRWKTHARYRARQCGAGRYVWATPHGLAFLVNHRGTRPIDPDHAKAMFDAGPGVELYFPDSPVELELGSAD